MENDKAINLVDKAIKDISGQQLVSSAEMTDLLLDIRLYLLTESSTPEHAVSDNSQL